MQILWETNHEIPIMNLFQLLMLKKPVFYCKIETPYEWFLIFLSVMNRSSRLQMFFKIGALKNIAILKIKKRLQLRYFSVRSSHVMLTIDRFPSQNAGIVILCHRSVFIFKELVYPPAHFSMFCKNKFFQL